MSLVAYAASSDDESDNDSHEESQAVKTTEFVDHISDEEDCVPVKENLNQQRPALILPVPKLEEEIDSVLPFFKRLPAPKASHETDIELVEEDDEFLHKKAIPLETPAEIVPPLRKNLVRITIPRLTDFDDVEERKAKKTNLLVKTSTCSSLMSILPQPKSEQIFVKAKPSNNTTESKKPSNKVNFVPDTVKNRRPAQNTENIERKVSKKSQPKPKAALVNVSDSDGSDEEGGDFFSLKKEDNLPLVSAEEIAAMVSKKAAEMADVTSKYAAVVENNKTQQEVEEQQAAGSVTNPQKTLDEEAVQALIGSQAKRRKMNEVEIIDISSDQVLPNKDEWLRTALASATTYQATGVLTDEEPAAGTRRKHQITYLAHKAKANEAELQAMWSANRQNRRQTQSKYGF